MGILTHTASMGICTGRLKGHTPGMGMGTRPGDAQRPVWVWWYGSAARPANPVWVWEKHPYQPNSHTNQGRTDGRAEACPAAESLKLTSQNLSSALSHSRHNLHNSSVALFSVCCDGENTGSKGVLACFPRWQAGTTERISLAWPGAQARSGSPRRHYDDQTAPCNPLGIPRADVL